MYLHGKAIAVISSKGGGIATEINSRPMKTLSIDDMLEPRAGDCPSPRPATCWKGKLLKRK
jgi:hypothetical protein